MFCGEVSNIFKVYEASTLGEYRAWEREVPWFGVAIFLSQVKERREKKKRERESEGRRQVGGEG